MGDLNARVSEADAKGSDEELLDLLINRGSVLKLLDSTVSAVADFEDAASIMEDMEDSGTPVDAGVFVKVYVSLGELFVGDGVGESTSEYYSIAASRLHGLNERSRYYNDRECVAMCVSCANDLLDVSRPHEAIPFLDKALETLGNPVEKWHRNRSLGVRNAVARAFMDMGDTEKALDTFKDAVTIGSQLYEEGVLEDEFELILPLVYAGDLMESAGDLDGFVECHLSAVSIMEEMDASSMKVDRDLLTDLHRGVAMALMKLGKAAEAEKHLMRVISLDVPAIDRAIDDLGIRR